MKDVDDLAQFIRRVDGNHTMGAGALAEAMEQGTIQVPPNPYEED